MRLNKVTKQFIIDKIYKKLLNKDSTIRFEFLLN